MQKPVKSSVWLCQIVGISFHNSFKEKYLLLVLLNFLFVFLACFISFISLDYVDKNNFFILKDTTGLVKAVQ